MTAHAPWTERYSDVPFLENGRTLSGADCWGLACLIWRQELEIDMPLFHGKRLPERGPQEPAGQYRWRCRAYFADEIRRYIGELFTPLCETVDEAIALPVRPGDGVLMRFGSEPSHVAVVCRAARHQVEAIHVYRGINSTVVKLGTRVWRNAVLGFYRPKIANSGQELLTAAGADPATARF